MSKLVQYSLLIFIAALFIKIIVNKIIIIVKSYKFLNKYFKDDNKLYSVKEVSEAFKLDEDHFLKLLSILEKYKYFTFFNKRKNNYHR